MGAVRNAVALQPLHRHRQFAAVAIGASAGGFHSIGKVLQSLKLPFTPAIFVVQHISPLYRSVLPALLGKHTSLPVNAARDGEQIEQSRVYIAPPDLHMIVADDGLHLLHSAQVKFSRPSIDLLFESVAKLYVEHAIALLLSGSGSDGTRGLGAVKDAGGVTIIEDPSTAEFGDMPRSALRSGVADYVLPISKIGPLVIELCRDERD